MSYLKLFLWPFSWVYNLLSNIRNYLYDNGYLISNTFNVTIIGVGNLNVGGSGKTPLIEYLIKLLKDQYHIATLSRGYGRKTKGFRLASDVDDATTLGDEPFQYYRKFGKEITVSVGEDRVAAISILLKMKTPPQVILMDDGFQHRSVKPHFSILLTEMNQPFYTDHVLPFGRLRESRKGAKRAQAIIVTKCNLIDGKKESVLTEIKKYTTNTPIFFSKLTYHLPQPLVLGNEIQQRVIVVSGIANSNHLLKHIKSAYQLVKHFNYNDHHWYTHSDIFTIQTYLKNHGPASIITTEKDMVKLVSDKFKDIFDPHNWFYLPVETTFLTNSSLFEQLITETIICPQNDNGQLIKK